MIAKKIKNPLKASTKSVRIAGLAKYIREPELTNGKEKCIHAGAVGFLAMTPAGQVAEMIALAHEAVRSADPISHYVLSWPEGEVPTAGQVDAAVLIFLDELGLSEHQCIYGLHDDTDNVHVHIQVNRVHPGTLRVIKPNGGWDIVAAHRAVARIEAAQGWKQEPRALFEVIDGHVVERDRDRKLSRKPSAEKQSREQWTGEMSAERIAQEIAAPLIQRATSWKELHALLAEQGMRYERKGSGALVFVGDVSLKASNVSRAASLSAMQKRLGPFESSTQENLNVYASHSRKPYLNHLRPETGNRMRNLSQCRVATVKGQQKGSSVLLVDARSGRRQFDGVRRHSHGGRIFRTTGRAAEPLKGGQPGWHDYIAARDALRSAKGEAVISLRKRHAEERKDFFTRCRAERSEAFAGYWKGRGPERNALASRIAVMQTAIRLEMLERQKAERAALRAEFKPLVSFKEWRDPALLGRLTAEEQRRTQEQRIAHHTKTLAATVRNLVASADKGTGFVTYKSEGRSMFCDTGRRIALLDTTSEKSIAAALAVAQTKFGRSLTLTGSPEVVRRMVAVAVQEHLQVTFTNPEFEALRQKLISERREIGWRDNRVVQSRSLSASSAKASTSLVEQPLSPSPDLDKKIDQIANWLKVHPEQRLIDPSPLPSSGRVLATANGRVLIHLNRDGDVGIFVAPEGVDIHVNDIVDVNNRGGFSVERKEHYRGQGD